MRAAFARAAVWTIRVTAIVVSVALVPLFFLLAVVASQLEKPT